MKYFIDRADHAPAYLQLYRQLRSDIAHEVYPAGSRLPSKRLLSEELGLSLVTVEHALALLCDEGYATAKERSGVFVSFRTGDRFLSADLPGPKRLAPPPQAAAKTQSFPFSVYAKAVRFVLANEGERLLLPAPPQGDLSLRNSICDYLIRTRGLQADPAQVVIGAGTEYLYHLLVLLLGRNKTFALEDPCYERIAQIYLAEDVRLERLPLGHDGIQTTALQQSAADVLHISPYRSFPSGITASASKRAAYLQWAAKAERWIVEDDFESEFSVSKKYEETLFAHSHRNCVIYLNTFSGTISPALRMGYMVVPPQLLKKLQSLLQIYSCTVPVLDQAVTAQLLQNGDFERHINRVRRQKRREPEAIRNSEFGITTKKGCP